MPVSYTATDPLPPPPLARPALNSPRIEALPPPAGTVIVAEEFAPGFYPADVEFGHVAHRFTPPIPPLVFPVGDPLNYQTPVGAVPGGVTWFPSPLSPDDWLHCNLLARGYFENDQRIEWSGVEATFGVEASLLAGARRDMGEFTLGAESEWLFTQPFDRNILVDLVERRTYRGNWEIDPFQISQLYFTGRRNDLLLALGKLPTPFGRTYFPLYKNDRSDAPFIRTESILWRETGLLMQWDPGNWVFTTALANGGFDRDANSSKGLVARVGYETDWVAFGGSVKRQDGIGSENQKLYNEHVGLDGMVRNGPWSLSGEVIYDVYGFRRPFSVNEITWGRSIYYRDQNRAPNDPITGVGYYLNLAYTGPRVTALLNYGEFYPDAIGDPRHDIGNWRWLGKLVWHHRRTDTYLIGIWENDVPNAQSNRLRQGSSILTGVQVSL